MTLFSAQETPPQYSLRNNNFDLLRFCLASAVFLVHAAVLSGSNSLAPIANLFSSEIAVKSFFVVSGFLIFMSYENSKTTKHYFVKRLRRIYPAYFFVVISSVLIGAIFSSYSFSQYFSWDTLNYVLANLVFMNFLHPNLPGLFDSNLHHAVNGALWTLKVEVMFYIVVPFIVFGFGKFGRPFSMIFLFVASIIYSAVLLKLHQDGGGAYLLELQRQLPGQLTFFVVGAAGYYYFENFKRYFKPLVFLATLSFLFKSHLPWLILEPISLAIIVVYFTTVFPYLGNFGSYGDFSYGVYILHFPILQLLISSHFFDFAPFLMLLVAGVTTLFFAMLLWHFIEKPFLQKGSHYVAK